MAQLLTLPTLSDPRGSLSVIEKILPFEIKRIFYLYDVKLPRGGHAHYKTQLALICVFGECCIEVNARGEKSSFFLKKANECLLLEPHEWHVMHSFSPHAVLLVLASEYYDSKDYIYEEPTLD